MFGDKRKQPSLSSSVVKDRLLVQGARSCQMCFSQFAPASPTHMFFATWRARLLLINLI